MKQRIFYIFALLLTTATLAAQTPPDTLDPRYVIDEAIVMGIALGYADGRKINGFRSDREPLENVLTIANK